MARGKIRYGFGCIFKTLATTREREPPEPRTDVTRFALQKPPSAATWTIDRGRGGQLGQAAAGCRFPPQRSPGRRLERGSQQQSVRAGIPRAEKTRLASGLDVGLREREGSRLQTAEQRCRVRGSGSYAGRRPSLSRRRPCLGASRGWLSSPAAPQASRTPARSHQ